MHIITNIALLTLLPLIVSAKPLHTYFGTNQSEGIYTATFDTATGNLSPITLAASIESPGFIAIHPNQAFLYATTVGSQKPNTGEVAAFQIQADGSLILLNKQTTEGRGTCHLSVDTAGQSVVVANYSSANVTALKILEDGALSPATSTHLHTGFAQHPKRQKGPHPHSAVVHPNNQYAYVPDLGIDKVMIYSLDSAQGIITPAGHADVPGGNQGPRHMKLSHDGKHAYVLNELSLSLATFSANPNSGQLNHIETLSVFTDDNQQAPDTMSCAEIRMHPSGKWLYTSTRDHSRNGRDTLSTFQIAKNGTATLIANTPASVDFPRNFNIDPSGQWLIVAGQRSSTLAIFSIDQNTGELTLKEDSIPFKGQPICVEFLK